MEIVRGPTGDVLGYVQKNGVDNYVVYDKNQRLVARETSAGTYDANGRFVGKGRLGLMLLR